MLHKIIIVLIVSLCSSYIWCQELIWEKTNSPGGDPMGALEVDSNGNIYAGGLSFISRSSDNGKTWKSITSGFMSYDIQIGSNGAIFAGSDHGIWRSLDGGVTWVQYPNISHEVRSIVFHEPNTYYAAVYPAGVYYSNNNGNTWNAVNDPISNDLTCLRVNEKGYLFAGTWYSGLYRSTNGGNSWTNVLENKLIRNIEVASDGSILVATSDGMLKSSDDGYTWGYILDANVFNSGLISFGISDNGYIYASLYDDKSIQGQLLLSTDNGGTWSYTGWSNSRINNIKAFNDTIYVTYSEGFAASYNKGKDWHFNSAKSRPSIVKGIAVAPSGNLYAAAHDNFFDDAGVYKSMDCGDSWIRLNVFEESSDINGIAYIDSSEMYIGTSLTGGIFKSIDGGYNWKKILEDEIESFVESRGELFACGSNDLYKYNKSTHEWDSCKINSYIWDVLSLSDNTILVSTNSMVAQLQKYIFVEGQWQLVKDNPIISLTGVSSLVVVPGKYILAGTFEHGVYYSTDEGLNWYSSSLDFSFVTALLKLPNKKVLASCFPIGVQITSDGITWEDYNYGMPPYNSGDPADSTEQQPDFIYSLSLLPDGNVFASTGINGSYKTVNPILADVKIPNNLVSNFSLQQNYPNPFNPTTTIEYSIPGISFVDLRVYDILGREVKVLVNEEKNAGTYNVKFDASNLASGVYYYSIKAGSYVNTKKLLLLK